MQQRNKITRVEVLCVAIMLLQGANYVFQMFGNPVKWITTLSNRVEVVEVKLAEKNRADSVFYATNLSDHFSIKQDILAIKMALVRKN